MNNLLAEHPALQECLDGLKHLFIDITRLRQEPRYGERRGGYCDLQVATLDSEIPSASKLVATKKLFLGFRSSEPLRLAVRLARELKVWAALRHPHVLPVLGFYLGNDYQTAMLISEYMTYGDLEGYIAKVKPSSFERLHLGNVLVNPERRALLADFGLSKALDAGPSGFTTGNDARGTVRFSGPEILLDGVEGQSLANDIWSWACLVLEVLTDKIPFADIRFEPQLIAALIKATQMGTTLLSSVTPTPGQQLQPERSTQQISASPETPSNRPNHVLQPSSQVNHQPQPGQPGRPMHFHEFFTKAFDNWLAQKQLMLVPPRIDGKGVELHKLFLMVGALGGCRAVFEKKLWPVVGAKIGFPDFSGPLPYSKPEVADQLSKIYQNLLADFEVHWHTSLRPRDPRSVFPLPPQLQYLHPEIERLATPQFPLQQQQPQQQQQLQRPLGAGPPQQPDASARGPTPNQMGQQTPQMGKIQAATQQQEAIMRKQPGVAFPSQPGSSGQGGPMGIPSLLDLPPMVPQLFNNPDIQKLSPDDLKRRGLGDDVIQKVLVYRQQAVAKQIQTRKEQELLLQQQRQIQEQQVANVLDTQKETPQLTPGNQPSPGLGEPQKGLGANALQISAPVQPPQLPPSVPLLPGLNVPQEQLMKAQEKVRAALGLFHNKGNYSSVNLSHEQGILMEQSIQQTQSLLKQVAQNVISFVVLAPNDEGELNRIARTIVTVTDQRQILEKPPPEKRFIFGLGDLNNYRNHLTTFLNRAKGLQAQAIVQAQNNSGVFLPVPPPVAQQEPPRSASDSARAINNPIIDPPTSVDANIPATVNLPRRKSLPAFHPSLQRPGGVQQIPSLLTVADVNRLSKSPEEDAKGIAFGNAFSQPSDQISQSAPTSERLPTSELPRPQPTAQSLVAPNKRSLVERAGLPPRREATGLALNIQLAGDPGPSQPEVERATLKRGREDDVSSSGQSAGPSGFPKRTRRDFEANVVSGKPGSEA
ncbi:hypothetical protein FRC00_001397 [Tulasnella sp. 408]|nr:hypothetical protein FRC00_001397 [Tulasnella sp. 408]